MMPSTEQMTAAMARLGVGEGTRVVLYDRAVNMWAARVWWMLRAVGFDQAAVLNGGWKKWTLEKRPTSTAPCAYPPGRFVARPRPDLFVGKSAVLAGLGERATCVLNALSEEQHRGTGGVAYGRPGRIAGSGNVPARALVDSATHAYLAPDVLRRRFAEAGALAARAGHHVLRRRHRGQQRRVRARLAGPRATSRSTTPRSPSGRPTQRCRWRRASPRRILAQAPR